MNESANCVIYRPRGRKNFKNHAATICARGPRPKNPAGFCGECRGSLFAGIDHVGQSLFLSRNAAPSSRWPPAAAKPTPPSTSFTASSSSPARAASSSSSTAATASASPPFSAFKPTNYTKGIRSVGNSSRHSVARRSVVRQRISTGVAESLYHSLKSARLLVRLDHGAGLIEQADDRGLRAREEFRVTDRVTDCVRF